MCPVLVQHHRALGKHQLNPVRGGAERTELFHPAGRVRAHPPSPGLEHGPIPAGKAQGQGQGQEPGPGSPSLTPSNQGDNSALPFAFNLKFFSSPCCRREGKHPRPPGEGKGPASTRGDSAREPCDTRAQPPPQKHLWEAAAPPDTSRAAALHTSWDRCDKSINKDPVPLQKHLFFFFFFSPHDGERCWHHSLPQPGLSATSSAGFSALSRGQSRGLGALAASTSQSPAHGQHL